MIKKIYSISDVINKIGDFNFNDWIFCEKFEKLRPDTNCIIITDLELQAASDPDNPEPAKALGMSELLLIDTIDSIIEFEKNKNKSVTQYEIIEAVEHFFIYDAYRYK